MFAGPEAQRLVTRRYDHVGARDDRHQALDRVLCVVGSEEQASAYGRWLQLRAKELVQNTTWRRAVEALADALLQKRTLTGKKAIDIMRQASGLPDLPEVYRKLAEQPEVQALIRKMARDVMREPGEVPPHFPCRGDTAGSRCYSVGSVL